MRNLILIGFITFIVIACKSDDDATMTCPEGYEGVNCTIAFNEKFVGAYSLMENCDTGPASYATTIEADANDPIKIKILGLWEEPAAFINAAINTDNSKEFVVVRQNFSNGGWDISAAGNINENGVVSILYTTYNQADNSIIDNCTSTMTSN